MTQVWVRCIKCGILLPTKHVRVEEASIPSISIFVEPHKCEEKTK